MTLLGSGAWSSPEPQTRTSESHPLTQNSAGGEPSFPTAVLASGHPDWCLDNFRWGIRPSQDTPSVVGKLTLK